MFLIEGVLRSNNLFFESWSEYPITYDWTLFHVIGSLFSETLSYLKRSHLDQFISDLKNSKTHRSVIKRRFRIVTEHLSRCNDLKDPLLLVVELRFFWKNKFSFVTPHPHTQRCIHNIDYIIPNSVWKLWREVSKTQTVSKGQIVQLVRDGRRSSLFNKKTTNSP